jgi:hypothetical protein
MRSHDFQQSAEFFGVLAVGWPHELGELHQKVFREVLVGDI